MIKLIESRKQFACSCGCGKKAVIGAFVFFQARGTRYGVLPQCREAFIAELAAKQEMQRLVRQRWGWLMRPMLATALYRLQVLARKRTEPRGARRKALRSALIYALPQRLGLALARRWRWN